MMLLPSSIQKRVTKIARWMAERAPSTVVAELSVGSSSGSVDLDVKAYFVAEVRTLLVFERSNVVHIPNCQHASNFQMIIRPTPRNIVISALPTAAFLRDA
jgi:hypothetical protein